MRCCVERRVAPDTQRHCHNANLAFVCSHLYYCVLSFSFCIYRAFSLPHFIIVCLFFSYFSSTTVFSSVNAPLSCLSDRGGFADHGGVSASTIRYGTSVAGSKSVDFVEVFAVHVSLALLLVRNISTVRQPVSMLTHPAHVFKLFASVRFSIQLYCISFKTNAVVRSEVLRKCRLNGNRQAGGRSVGQSVSRRPLTAEGGFLSWNSEREICVGQSGIRRGFSPNTCVVCGRYHSTSAPYSFICHRCYSTYSLRQLQRR